jgi:hypothetical protein
VPRRASSLTQTHLIARRARRARSRRSWLITFVTAIVALATAAAVAAVTRADPAPAPVHDETPAIVRMNPVAPGTVAPSSAPPVPGVTGSESASPTDTPATTTHR